MIAPNIRWIRALLSPASLPPQWENVAQAMNDAQMCSPIPNGDKKTNVATPPSTPMLTASAVMRSIASLPCRQRLPELVGCAALGAELAWSTVGMDVNLRSNFMQCRYLAIGLQHSRPNLSQLCPVGRAPQMASP